MDDDLADLKNRQTRTERRVSDLETTVKREAGLRATMDNELGTISATLKAHTQSLNALREDQSAQGKQLQRIELKVENTELAIGYLNGRMDLLDSSVNGRMDSLESSLHGRMDSLESSVNGRMDSISGRMDSLESSLNGRMDSISGRMDSLESQMTGVKAGVDEILVRLGNG